MLLLPIFLNWQLSVLSMTPATDRNKVLEIQNLTAIRD